MSFTEKYYGNRMASRKQKTKDIATFIAIRLFVFSVTLLPYRYRVPVAGYLVSRLFSPMAGFPKRIRENLGLVFPNMPKDEVEELVKSVPENAGRTIIEIFSGKKFSNRFNGTELQGEGAKELERAHIEARPVILVTGHFGNYDAPRAALLAKGYDIGALYREMNNSLFNKFYVSAISKVGTPIFPRNRKGLTGFVRHLRDGGMVGILIDQYYHDGAHLQFFGHNAPTALSAAELAIKYNALVVPIYGIRQKNGLDFKIVCESSIPHSSPEEMTQSLNDSLERMVRQHIDQWFWIHKRWKPERNTEEKSNLQYVHKSKQ